MHAVLVVMLSALVVVLLATNAFAARTVYAPKDCSKPRVEPSRIVTTCADAGFYFTAKNWKYWNGHEAGGKVKEHANDCEQSCIGGNYHKFEASIRLSKVRVQNCNGRRVPMFQKATFHFSGRKPHGIKRTQHFPLTCLNF
jgi:hypothetical protein